MHVWSMSHGTKGYYQQYLHTYGHGTEPISPPTSQASHTTFFYSKYSLRIDVALSTMYILYYRVQRNTLTFVRHHQWCICSHALFNPRESSIMPLQQVHNLNLGGGALVVDLSTLDWKSCRVRFALPNLWMMRIKHVERLTF